MKKGRVIIVLLLIIAIVAIVIVLAKRNGDNKNNETKPENNQSQSQGGTSSLGTGGDGENTTNPLQPGQPAGDYATRGNSGNKINTSGKLQDTKNLKGLELNNVNLETLGNKTIMLADVKNTTDKTVEEKKVKVDLLAEDGKVVKTLEGVINTVEAGQMTQLNVEAEGDYVDVYDYNIYE